ncbi:hypothetical protein DV113_004460 [Geotrichum candidum]|uniref:ribonuclease Z n=1 Tax=Geotrichum candidum TaxID=1173061 RepID=A0A0J9XI61_GEOCN|nr:hypothetical protein DV113_004460 [Geotrichum candidum]KAI8133119.1 hypothetical protein DUD61_003231 [Geotrichum candidum]CDO56641.1 similar to Saccharomyces cerevisiae YKR079C TRZ1 tRNA 3'-end processing endonuclease tRNase Z [Geotrichum candidum]
MYSPFHSKTRLLLNEQKQNSDVNQAFPILNSKTVIQVMSHGTTDCPSPALLLQTVDGRRHVFGGIGEGFQRLMTQSKIKMGKFTNIFLTGNLNWERMGGLPGLLLTIADQGVKSINVHSSNEHIGWACAAWRHFIFRQNIDLNPNSLAVNRLFEDKYFYSLAIAISKDKDAAPLTEEQEKEHEKVNDAAKNIVKRMFPRPGDKVDSKDATSLKLNDIVSPDTTSSSYIIQIKQTRGRFNVEKANKLGVPKGSIRSVLSRGEPITLEDGTVVTPDQVLEPTINGPRVLVIDCPGAEYVDSVLSQDWVQSLSPAKHPKQTGKLLRSSALDNSASPPLKRQRTDNIDSPYDGLSEKPAVVYHFLGKSVNPFEGPYFDWLLKSKDLFKEDCMHFIQHPDYAPDGITFDSAALLNIKLRYLYPDNFRVLQACDAVKQMPANIPENIRLGYGFGVVSLEPAVQYDGRRERSSGAVDMAEIEEFTLSPLKAKLAEANLSIEGEPTFVPPEIPETHLKDVEVITIGTGSALPSKYRNVVSTLVRVKPGERKSILFDCGEATIGNLRRLFGVDESIKVLRELQILYLSHLHADHHLGAISFIRHWLEANEGSDAPLYVMGPWKYFQFLHEWTQLEEAVSMGRIKFVDNESFIIGSSFLADNNRKIDEIERFAITDSPSFFYEMKEKVGLSDVRTCKAKHCDLAYCVSFTFDLSENQKFQVAYSGDTRPTNMFAFKVGQGADLLIHEATHENGLEKEAAKKRHTTIGQALDVARKMNAKYTILTHFSQRYPKLPNIESTSDTGYMSENESTSDYEGESLIPLDNGRTSVTGTDDLKVALAFDGMGVKLKDIEHQKRRYEQLKLFFAEVAEEESKEEQEDQEQAKPATKKKSGKGK